MPKSTDNNAAETANDLASRLRQAAQQIDGGAPRATTTVTPRPAAAPNWSEERQPSLSSPTGWAPAGGGPSPSYPPVSGGGGGGGGGGGRTMAIVAGAVAAVVVLGLIGFALMSGAGDNAEKKFTEVPATLGGGVFSGISGYTLSAAPPSDVEAVRNGIVSRTDPANLESVEGRMVVKSGKNVAEAFAIVFAPGANVNPQVGVDAVASQLATSQNVTIAGATGIYGKTSGGTELIVVYKGNTGIVVTGSGRATLEDITAKLVANA
ncbi:MAG: hypothetical protein ACRD12_03410 [Acidimicrobiales bacterium]